MPNYRFAVLCLAVLALDSETAQADEGGVPFWLSGQYASLSAVPPTPGWSLTLLPYYYNGSAGGPKSFDRGGAIVAGLHTQLPALFAFPSYAPETKVLDGQPTLALGWGVGRNSTQVDASVAIGDLTRQVSRSDSIDGGSDLYPTASIAWAKGNNNWMTYLTGDIPTGAYQSQRLSNIGIGHGAIDAGGGYTYLNGENGREFSAVVGFTYNWENTHTNYKNGVDSHLDWAASQFLSENWEIGVAGYVYCQLSGDNYPTSGPSGDLRSLALGSFKSRIAAAGPEVGYAFKVGNKPAYLNIRAYWEFWAQNRVEGYALFATLNVPLGH
jgi:hypothetical protein